MRDIFSKAFNIILSAIAESHDPVKEALSYVYSEDDLSREYERYSKHACPEGRVVTEALLTISSKNHEVLLLKVAAILKASSSCTSLQDCLEIARQDCED